MKKLMILAVAAAVLAWAGYAMAAREKGEAKGRAGARGKVAAQNDQKQMGRFNPSDPNAIKQRTEIMQQRRKMMHARIEKLEKIKELAVGENATKTAEALDKFIEQEKKIMEKMLQGQQGRGAAAQGEKMMEGKKKGMGPKDGKGNRRTPKKETQADTE
ncbi:MAG: hypothetical protein ISS77_08370 [Phycisphaerae bacterium]|nr:hypothetical protein [Phycisphaerae bacterium]